MAENYSIKFYMIHLLYPFFHCWVFRLIPCLGLAGVNSAAVNLQVHVSFQIRVFSGYRPRSETAGSYGTFIIGDWYAKVGSQETPGVTGKFGLRVRNEVGQRLTEFCQENALVKANIPFQQHKRRLYTWTSPDSQYPNQID